MLTFARPVARRRNELKSAHLLAGIASNKEMPTLYKVS